MKEHIAHGFTALKRELNRLILCFAVTSSSAAHCGTAETAPDTDAQKIGTSSQKGDARQATDKNASVIGELERLKKEAAAAFETRDWSKARRLIAKGLNLASEDKDDLEIISVLAD